jgi:hypothetical protein
MNAVGSVNGHNRGGVAQPSGVGSRAYGLPVTTRGLATWAIRGLAIMATPFVEGGAIVPTDSLVRCTRIAGGMPTHVGASSGFRCVEITSEMFASCQASLRHLNVPSNDCDAPDNIICQGQESMIADMRDTIAKYNNNTCSALNNSGVLCDGPVTYAQYDGNGYQFRTGEDGQWSDSYEVVLKESFGSAGIHDGWFQSTDLGTFIKRDAGGDPLALFAIESDGALRYMSTNQLADISLIWNNEALEGMPFDRLGACQALATNFELFSVKIPPTLPPPNSQSPTSWPVTSSLETSTALSPVTSTPIPPDPQKIPVETSTALSPVTSTPIPSDPQKIPVETSTALSPVTSTPIPPDPQKIYGGMNGGMIAGMIAGIGLGSILLYCCFASIIRRFRCSGGSSSGSDLEMTKRSDSYPDPVGGNEEDSAIHTPSESYVSDKSALTEVITGSNDAEAGNESNSSSKQRDSEMSKTDPVSIVDERMDGAASHDRESTREETVVPLSSLPRAFTSEPGSHADSGMDSKYRESHLSFSLQYTRSTVSMAPNLLEEEMCHYSSWNPAYPRPESPSRKSNNVVSLKEGEDALYQSKGHSNSARDCSKRFPCSISLPQSQQGSASRTNSVPSWLNCVWTRQ